MNQKNTHITLLNKKERFAYHLGDVLLIVLFYTILIVGLIDKKEADKLYNAYCN